MNARQKVMTKEIAIHNLFALKLRSRVTSDREALDMAIKALEQTRWVSTSEKLPEDYTHVLCQFALCGMAECYLAHGLFHVVGGVRLSHDEVIAWMPLPEPYKDREEVRE